jgi:protoporphyrinogen oxidase
MTQKIAVLGGGAAGVVASAELAARGAIVELFERAPSLGGLHRSVVIEGDAFDTGAFVFNDDHTLVKTFPALKHLYFPARVGHTTLTPGGSLDRYPVTLRGYVNEHGWPHAARALGSLLVAKVRDRKRDSVPAFAQYYMGRQLYFETGLRDYIERLYGVPDYELGLEFALQRLEYVSRFTREKIAGLFSQRIHQTPVYPLLLRPRDGFGVLYGEIARSLEARGVVVRVGDGITGIRKNGHGFEVDSEKSSGKFDAVVSTLPALVMLRLLGESTSTHFEHVGLLSLFYRGEFIPETPILYNFTNSGRWKRMTIFSRYYGKSRGMDFLTVEVTTTDNSAQRREELMTDFESHAMRYGLFRSPPMRVGEALTAQAYPLFRPNQAQNVQRELKRIQSHGVYTAGRQGNHEYLSSHDAALQARDVARKIPLH